MARSLPLQAFVSDADVATAPATERVLSGTVTVYDPALCCPTGVCGPGVDPALLQIARDLRWLEVQGAAVTRVGLSQEPQAFVANGKVTGLMQAFDDGALPAVLVNEVVLTYGRYPSREEMVAALSPALPTVAAAVEQGTDGTCCTPGGGCC